MQIGEMEDTMKAGIKNVRNVMIKKVVGRVLKVGLFVMTFMTVFASTFFTSLILVDRWIATGKMFFGICSILCVFSAIYMTTIVIEKRRDI